MINEPHLHPHHFSARRSASAEKSREDELSHLKQMTVEERIHSALGMKERFSWLKPFSDRRA
jgi:hypothetical protein